MLIQEIRRDECLNLLARLHLGRIACLEGIQPYVVPFYFAYDDGYLYSFSTVGQKIRWMRANPAVCVQADEVASPEEWISLVIFGRYQELPETAEFKVERDSAYRLLQRKGVWWEPGYAKTEIDGIDRPLIPVYFRIQIVQMTGRHGANESSGSFDVKRLPADNSNKTSLQGILAALRAKLFSK